MTQWITSRRRTGIGATCWPQKFTNVEILTLFYTLKQWDRDQMGERRTWEAKYIFRTLQYYGLFNGRPIEFFPTHACDDTHLLAEIGLYNMN
jgi:hypothetical protein